MDPEIEATERAKDKARGWRLRLALRIGSGWRPRMRSEIGIWGY